MIFDDIPINVLIHIETIWIARRSWVCLQQIAITIQTPRTMHSN